MSGLEHERIERYSVDDLLGRDAAIRVLRQEIRQAAVHWHDFYELVFVLDGTARHVRNGVAELIGPGHVVLLTPADFHELAATSPGPLVCYNVVIDARAAERELDGLLGPGSTWFTGPATTGVDLERDFARLWRESSQPRLGSSALMTALLRCILIELARLHGSSYQAGDTGPRMSAQVRRAVWYVERHFREPLTLSGVAAEACLSANYFSARFREATGRPFQVYLQDLRLRFARSLLVATTLGVTEVCHASGFNSLSHFGRAYRRRYGEPPSATVQQRPTPFPVTLDILPGEGDAFRIMPNDLHHAGNPDVARPSVRELVR